MTYPVGCRCGQLTIELKGLPVSCDGIGGSLHTPEYKQQQDLFSYFRSKDVIGTTGEASCISLMDNSGWQLNRYHCDECDSALFCVLTEEAESLIGVATDYLEPATVLIPERADTGTHAQAL